MAEQSGKTPRELDEKTGADLEFLVTFGRNLKFAMEADTLDLQSKPGIKPAFVDAKTLLDQPSGKTAGILARALLDRPDLIRELLVKLCSVVDKFDTTFFVNFFRAVGELMVESRMSTADDSQPSSQEERTSMLPAAVAAAQDGVTAMCQAVVDDEPVAPGSQGKA
ncbi:MAG: hypothetical protein WCT53_00855 [Candidatus Gracilibacteria bacterium]|jgi:hypothetical protein